MLDCFRVLQCDLLLCIRQLQLGKVFQKLYILFLRDMHLIFIVMQARSNRF